MTTVVRGSKWCCDERPQRLAVAAVREERDREYLPVAAKLGR